VIRLDTPNLELTTSFVRRSSCTGQAVVRLRREAAFRTIGYSRVMTNEQRSLVRAFFACVAKLQDAQMVRSDKIVGDLAE
jgi:hypothetical protein